MYHTWGNQLLNNDKLTLGIKVSEWIPHFRVAKHGCLYCVGIENSLHRQGGLKWKLLFSMQTTEGAIPNIVWFGLKIEIDLTQEFWIFRLTEIIVEDETIILVLKVGCSMLESYGLLPVLLVKIWWLINIII